MKQMQNLFANLPDDLPDELVTVLFDAAEVRIERIVSRGHASLPGFWYDQPSDEWVLLLRGSARLEFEDRAAELTPGDYLLIAAHQRHRVAATSESEDTVWLAVHLANDSA